MNGVWTLDDKKIVDEAAVRTQCLGTHASLGGIEILFANLGYELLQTAHERFFAEGTVHFREAGSCVLCNQSPEPRIAHGIDEISQIEGCPMIAFALEAKDCVRSGMNTAVDHASEVHAEKRKFRIRHRIDEISHQVPAFGLQLVVFAPERHYARIRFRCRLVRLRDHCADRHN